MKQSHLRFPCGELSLEGVVHMPEGMGPFAAVVVCHPHPHFGGTMDNNVVVAVSEALCRESIIALRFNLRGVGASGGRLTEGIGEQEDVKAALSFIASMDKVSRNRVGLCGYSSGAVLALSVARQDERVQALAAISPPLFEEWESLQGYPRPKLFVWGSRDMFIPGERLEKISERLSSSREQEVIEGADHFWWGYEDRVAARVAAFFARNLR